MPHPGTILIVDDDKFSRNFYCDLLAEDGHSVESVASGQAALKRMGEQHFDMVITDIVMPEMDGLELLNQINEGHPQVDVIVTTGYAAVDSAVQALKSGAKDYLRKPVNAEEFRLTVNRNLEQRHLFAENREFQKFLGLFEACHRISGCLDLERLVQTSVNSLCQELETSDVWVYTTNEEGSQIYSVVEHRSFEFESWIQMIGQEENWQSPLDCPELTLLEEGFDGPENLTRVLLLPVRVGDQTVALFTLLYFKDSPGLSVPIEALKKRARFMGRQIALSWENAEKFSVARDQIYVDHLTGLHNAKYLSTVLSREVKRCKRFKQNLSVLFIDVDHFKEVNDTSGHLVGSNLLQEMGKLIKSCMRDIDTAVRYGGDEFTLVLVNTDSGGATKVAERIRQKIESHVFSTEDRESGPVRITVCIGIASYPEHAGSSKELLDMADQAMYRGKRTTRNVVYVFNPTVQSVS